MGDIPYKYFEPMSQLPTPNASIDADFKDFVKAFKLIRTLKESDMTSWQQRITERFAKNKEDTLVTLSVRSAWDLYF